jgi:hypothetical protein
MSAPNSDRPVTVHAQERAHPALLKIARACIALGRRAIGAPPAVIPANNTQTANRPITGSEVGHD